MRSILMVKTDSIGEHLKSDEYKKKKALQKANEIIDRHKTTRPKRTPEEIQALINTYRDQLQNENMQPPPPATFVDEFGKPIFENKSDINFGGMPQRFKGERAGIPLGDKRDSLSDARQSNLNEQKLFPQPPPMTQKQHELANKEFYETTTLDFKDISGEVYREYMYNNGGVLRIDKPWKLAVSRSNNHRVVTTDGFSYIIAPTWIAIRFKKKKGEPSFAF